MLPAGEQGAERSGVEPRQCDQGARAIAGEVAVQVAVGRVAAERERRGLGEAVGDQDAMAVVAGRGRRGAGLAGHDEVDRHDVRTLVQLLEKRMLGVGAGGAPDDRSGGSCDARTRERGRLAVALHHQLLRPGGQQPQPLGVGDDRLRRQAEEGAVPDRDQTEPRRQVRADGRVAEMAVHAGRAIEQCVEHGRTAGDRDAQPDARPQRVASADPVAELQQQLGQEAAAVCRLGGRGHADELCCRAVGRAAAGDEPRACRIGVGQRLAGREGLGDDCERGAGRVQPVELACEVVRVDVGDEADVEVARRAQRVADEARAEVRAADSDADERGDRRAPEAGQAAAAQSARERGHPAALRGDVRGDRGVTAYAAQGGM